MKRITENVLMLLVTILVATFVGMALTGCSTTESVTGPVRAGDVTNTGCQSHTRGTSIIGNPTLKLTKDGVNLQAEFHDYRVNCAYKDVSVECAAKDGVLDIKVGEVMEGDVYANCLCPVTIYCTIYNANESEYKLKINQEDFGFISFKDHDITEIDLWNHEQAHEEGFDYSLVPTSDDAYEITPFNLEGREDWLPRITLFHYENEVGMVYQYFLLPKEYNDLHVEGEAKGDTIMMKVVTDGVITKDSPRRGSASCIFANATSSTYHFKLIYQSLVKDTDGNTHETITPIFEKTIDMPVGENQEIIIRTNEDDALLGRWQYTGFMYDGFGGKIFKEDGTIISWMSMYSGEYSESEWGLWWINEKGEIVVKMGTKEPMPDETYYKIISITDDEMVIREFGGFAGIPFEEGYDIVYKRIDLY